MKIYLPIVLASLLSAPAYGAGVSTHAMVVAGQAGAPPGAGQFACATSGPQTRESNFFNTGIPLPSEGYAYCNLAGAITNDAAPFGFSFSSEAVIAAFNGGNAELTAQARSGFVGMGVETTGAYDGAHDSNTYTYSEAAAYTLDRIMLPGSGSGALQLRFDIEGTATGSEFSDNLIYLNYQLGSGPIYTAFVGYAGRGTGRAYAPTVAGATVPGFTVTPGAISGTALDIPTFYLPVTLGGAIDLTVGLYAASYVGNRPGVLGSADVRFLSTAKLSGFYLYDGLGQLIDKQFLGESGTIYDRFGAHLAPGVPEPSVWALMIAGFFAAGGGLRRSNRQKHAPACRRSVLSEEV